MIDNEPKQKVKQTFSKHAQKYIDSKTHAKGADLPLLLEWANPQPDWTALDIATGGGHVAKLLSSYVKRIFATDLTKQMLENTANHLRDLANIDYVIADAENLPFIDNQFDLITCRIAPHHFPNPDLFIKEVYRTLKKGGIFCFIDNVAPDHQPLHSFMNTFEKLRDPSHVKALSISEWKNLLSNTSFSILKEKTGKKDFLYEDWLKRTVESEAVANQVTSFFKNADDEMKKYFHIKQKDRNIESFAIDEWMVICQKSDT